MRWASDAEPRYLLPGGFRKSRVLLWQAGHRRIVLMLDGDSLDGRLRLESGQALLKDAAKTQRPSPR